MLKGNSFFFSSLVDWHIKSIKLYYYLQTLMEYGDTTGQPYTYEMQVSFVVTPGDHRLPSQEDQGRAGERGQTWSCGEGEGMDGLCGRGSSGIGITGD